ncbi:MAG: hypothetical protein FIB07_16990 [Candidatus Methanoperedens sp.]|nr:hypothetical protein [Candidatus Methanoperedens sp.]
MIHVYLRITMNIEYRKIQKTKASFSINIPSKIVKELKLEAQENMTIESQDGKIIIKKVEK